MKQLTLLICLGFLLASLSCMADPPEPKLRLHFLAAKGKITRAMQKNLQKSDELNDISSLLNDELVFTHPVGIVFGTRNGPVYNRLTHNIEIPYEFVLDLFRTFRTAHYERTGLKPDEAAMDTLYYVLFHELGHVLMDMYQLPVLGKEEDAADNLATIMLVEYFDGGSEIALSAADLFEISSPAAKSLQEEDYWDEHSLDAQRAYGTLCLVYGSNPKRYASIARDHKFPPARRQRCQYDYHKLKRSWDILLGPYLKDRERLWIPLRH